MSRALLHNAFCDAWGIEVPIFLAGMGVGGRATPPALVAAVSQAGGLGVLGCSGLSPEETRRRIREVRTLTDKPFGVDLLLPARIADAPPTRTAVREEIRARFPKHAAFVQELIRRHGLPDVKPADETVVNLEYAKSVLKVIFDERVPVFAAGLGDPDFLLERARAQGMKLIGLSGSVRNAVRQKKSGVDAVVAQGTEAGGHTGTVASLPLIPQVVDAVSPTPVLAAGGIADGRGIVAALALGAQAVWIGTAFLVADEGQLFDACKDQIVAADSEAFRISKVWTGKTVRAFHGEIAQAWAESGLPTLETPHQRILMEDFLAAALAAGRHDLFYNIAGQAGGLVKARRPAKDIMAELVDGAVEQLRRLQRDLVVSLP
ncbi:MAG: nitronate monooxygenase [Rubrivivax sp.]|nr:nitronate monooxygenase [Rubrivivax sp.]